MPPFAWQKRLVRQVCTNGWPAYIKLPTASGKTAAIDVAVFSLAYQAAEANRQGGRITTPRRIFFVVDRRIIVNEAYRRAAAAAKRLRNVLDSESQVIETPDNKRVLTRVALWLRALTASDTAPPLDCFELRGGIYRNDAWVRSLLQPTVLTSTVDQVGSRLLFRGYGVADTSLSIHAALTGNDSLIILDEAHCSKPFSQTLSAVKAYRSEKWASDGVPTPFQFVEMTATPPAEATGQSVLELTEEDYRVDPLLETRHACSKPVKLIYVSGAKGAKLNKGITTKLVEQAVDLTKVHKRKKIAVVVNRVAIARDCYSELDKKYPGRVHLMIGRMRPIDRDELTKVLHREFGSYQNDSGIDSSVEADAQFVVATQCLEVGADLDFDGMVTQCASLDALRQRFGRLNRLGNTAGAYGVVVAAEGDVPPLDKLNPEKPLDPIYGNSLAKTWHWLSRLSGFSTAESQLCLKKESENIEQGSPTIDFGIKSLDSLLPNGETLAEMLAPSEDAPVLMPAHLDMLCQTTPRPTPEPDVASYLHGPNRGLPEVRVCWRADLDLSRNSAPETDWVDAVDLCPPSTAECLAVPLQFFRQWLRGEKAFDTSGDVLGELIEPSDDHDDAKHAGSVSRTVLVWRGRQNVTRNSSHRSFCANGGSASRIRPNDTIVIPVEFGGWEVFGHLPRAPKESSETPIETYSAMMGLIDDTEKTERLKALAEVDVADRAFLGNRAKTILRAHPKLIIERSLRTLANELLVAAKSENCDFSIKTWSKRAREIHNELPKEELEVNEGTASALVRLTVSMDNGFKGRICRYPGGVVWITPPHFSLTRSEILPLSTFGDDADELLDAGRFSLVQHLSDVHAEARLLVEGLGLSRILAESTVAAAQFHDIGKADPRFQAVLIDKPLSVVYMQPQLWAKSDNRGRQTKSVVPSGFRHEMLSLQLVNYLQVSQKHIDQELFRHAIASHHGHARPFAPTCFDTEPEDIDLSSLGGGIISSEARRQWIPAHRLDSGVSERFWSLNRKYGWWGLAFLESLLRLSDWQASALPGRAAQSLTFSSDDAEDPKSKTRNDRVSTLTLEGLDGSNPLAFLTALGAFRSLVNHAPQSQFKLSWAKSRGAWRPVLRTFSSEVLTEESLLDVLEACLDVAEADHPSLRLATLIDTIGIRMCFRESSETSTMQCRQDAEWLSCNGSDLADSSSISQLQTTRRDYHSINIRGLLEKTNREHLRRSLFLAWDYADPIAGLSLHIEPREDRRHAYQWHTPSGDPTRAVSGGMIGANRLALEAWPLFQSLPAGDKLTTVGFRGLKANNTRFYWPVWSVPIDLETLNSVLSLSTLDTSDDREVASVQAMSIEAVFRARRILVGKTPNFTISEPVLVK